MPSSPMVKFENVKRPAGSSVAALYTISFDRDRAGKRIATMYETGEPFLKCFDEERAVPEMVGAREVGMCFFGTV
jgi:hypothetical protein